MVSQHLELFSGSLRSNIEYGLKGCPSQKVEDTAKKAKVHALLSELKDQYDTGTNALSLFMSFMRSKLGLGFELRLTDGSRSGDVLFE